MVQSDDEGRCSRRLHGNGSVVMRRPVVVNDNAAAQAAHPRRMGCGSDRASGGCASE